MTPAMATAVLQGGQRGRTPLTVLFDARCPLCRRLRTWMVGQPTLVPIEFVAAASPSALARFPQLDHVRTTTVLTVVGADGAVYEGERAWLVCAWTLPGWQPVAERFGSPHRLPLVRVFARTVDAYRHRLITRSYGPGCGGDCRVVAPPGASLPR